MKAPEGQITPHFAWREAACRCCGQVPDNPQIIINTATMMEKIRAALGNRTITVNSWYRCPKHNQRVGGAKNSLHLQGYAVDFTVSGLTPQQVQEALKPHFGAGKLITGLGRYSRFTHVDRRTSAPATWVG